MQATNLLRSCEQFYSQSVYPHEYLKNVFLAFIGTQTSLEDVALEGRTFVEMEIQCSLLEPPESDDRPSPAPVEVGPAPMEVVDSPESDVEEADDGDEYIPSDHTPSSDSEKTRFVICS